LRIGHTGLEFDYITKLWAAAIAGAAVAWGMKFALPALHPALAALLILGPYGLVFLLASIVMRIPEAASAFARIRRRI
jgi:hypothetical protein